LRSCCMAQIMGNEPHFCDTRRGDQRTCAPGEFTIQPETAAPTTQQGQTRRATASATAEPDACTASMDKAYGLCMARGFFNIMSVGCGQPATAGRGGCGSVDPAGSSRVGLDGKLDPMFERISNARRWTSRSRIENSSSSLHWLLRSSSAAPPPFFRCSDDAAGGGEED
jgi:hypothetical protein